MMTISSETKATVTGYILCILAVFGYGGGSAFAQLLHGYIPIFQLNAWRHLCQACLCAILLASMRKPPSLSPSENGWCLLTALFRWLGNVALFQAAIFLPGGTLYGVSDSFGIFIGILAGIVSTRTCRYSLLCPVVLCIPGLVLVSQPALLGFPDSPGQESDPYGGGACGNTTESPLMRSLNALWADTCSANCHVTSGYLLAVLSGTATSAGFIVIHHRLNNVHGIVISFWIGVFGLAFSLLAAVILEETQFPTGGSCWWLLLGYIFSLSPATLMINCAALLIPPGPLSILFSCEMIFTTGLQYTVLKHINPGHQNWEELLGILLLALGNISLPLLTVLQTKLESDKEHYTNIKDSKDVS